ncbi:putative cytochrome b/b6, di-hem cytochrome, transmembrane, cytochrome b/b6-like domain superfamily [Helianthus anomalus]
MTEANFGWLIRSVHRWSASMMVLMMILHVFRVYLTSGFKKSRELTWVTGVVLAVLTSSRRVNPFLSRIAGYIIRRLISCTRK